ncbi:MAG: transporter substrate-binding domain-containing protein [Clostridia bacterium]|nr:transporter substrate-binding domain-containing protein [Clostridia bacterium]MBO7289224.1 transporter substrate-binding domain-containing protein [Clostridia bacterium]
MKKFLKITSLLLVLVMTVCCLAACGGKDDKVLKMATNAEFPPFEYIEDGEIVGADVEIAQAIAEKLDKELEIVNIDFDAALTGAATGKYDMAVAGITANEDRKKNMNFTDEYYTASQAIIVMADSEIAAAKDLEGKKVSCQEGTTGEGYLLDNKYDVQSYKTGAEAISALTAGKVDAVVIDDAVARALSEKQEGKTVVLEEALTQEAYAIALEKGNDELTEEINGALKELKEEGKLAEIFEKYELPYDAE